MVIIVAVTIVVTLFATLGVPKLLSTIRALGIGSVTDDEQKVLQTVPFKWRKLLLHYLRTLEAPKQLQDHMASNIPCLKAVSKYMKKEYKNIAELNPP